MNERISRQEVSDALERRLSGLQDDPWLTAKVLSKAEGEKPVKKISVTAILVIALLALTMAGALAAALNAWGVIDFAGNLGWTYVPENARDSVTAENLTVETDHLICTIRESYYDGEILRVTADIEPKEKMLLVADDETIMPADNEEDCGVTAVEYAKAHFGSRLGDVYLFPEEMDVDCETEWRSNEDGSVTVYMACFFPDEQAERDAELELGYVPGRDLESLTDARYPEGPGGGDGIVCMRGTPGLPVRRCTGHAGGHDGVAAGNPLPAVLYRDRPGKIQGHGRRPVVRVRQSGKHGHRIF